MNIAIFAWEALEGIAVGGGAVYASRLASALAGAGHSVRLFTRMGRAQAIDEVVNGVRVRRCAWDGKREFIDEIAALSHSFAHYFADAVKVDGPYDVVHCHEWLTIAAGLRALRLSPARLAVSFHSTEWGRTGVWPDSGDSARIANVEREGVERADTVICASQWAARHVRDQFHPPDWKCGVVYHGADLPDRLPGPESVRRIRRAAGLGTDAPSLLFAGSYTREGGGDLAARAVGLASRRFPGARFLFFGRGPLEAAMREEAGPGAIFVPPEDGTVPSEYYRSVDLVLAPFRRDHSGRAVMPAWAASRPVAVLEDTVPSEFVLHDANGWRVRDDPEELAAVVMNAFANPRRTAWMGANGRAAAETAFAWEKSAERLLACYTARDRVGAGTA